MIEYGNDDVYTVPKTVPATDTGVVANPVEAATPSDGLLGFLVSAVNTLSEIKETVVAKEAETPGWAEEHGVSLDPVVAAQHQAAVEAKLLAHDISVKADEAYLAAKNSWLGQNVLPTFDAVKDWAESWSTPTGRLADKSGGFWAPFVLGGKAAIGGTILALTAAPYETLETWASGQAARPSEVMKPVTSVLSVPAAISHGIMTGVVGGWLGMDSAAQRMKEEGSLVNQAEKKIEQYEATHADPSWMESLSDIWTLGNTVAGGVVAGVGAAAVGAPLLGAIPGIAAWWAAHGLKSAVQELADKDFTPTVVVPDDGGDGTVPDPVTKQDPYVINVYPSPAPIIHEIIKVVTDPTPPVDERPKPPGTGMAGGGAAFMPKRKSKKKRNRTRPGRPDLGRSASARRSLKTSAVPSPNQSMGGGRKSDR